MKRLKTNVDPVVLNKGHFSHTHTHTHLFAMSGNIFDSHDLGREMILASSG